MEEVDYEAPLTYVVEQSIASLTGNEALPPELQPFAHEYFFLGATVALEMINQGFAFPDGTVAQTSLRTLLAEAHAQLDHIAGFDGSEGADDQPA